MTDNSEIGFYSAAGPGSPHGNIPEFNDVIFIDKGLAVLLVDSGPNFPANLGQYLHTDVIVVQFDHLPGLLSRLIGEAVVTEIRINLFKIRYGIWIGEGIRFKRFLILFDRRILLGIGTVKEKSDHGGDQ